ncbi:MAG: hypothetical protein ACFFD5_09325 [Candidatus Thorarchaeota archaeon]
MENRQLLDVKLKKLIQVCKQTLNYRKLAVVGFILQSNLIDEIGLKLAFRLRNKSAGEKVYEYMKAINDFFWHNLRINIFRSDLIESMKRVELIFLAKRGDISMDYIKELFKIYFTIRNVHIPNLQEEITLKDFTQESHFNYLSFLARRKQSKNSTDKIKPLLLHKISQKEALLRDSYDEQNDEKTFRDLLKLNALKKSIKRSTPGKIIIHENLTDNLVYRASQQNIIKFAIWGVFIVFLMIIGLILYETMLIPYLTLKLSPVLLLGIISCIITFIIHKNYCKRRSYSNG